MPVREQGFRCIDLIAQGGVLFDFLTILCQDSEQELHRIRVLISQLVKLCVK